MKTQDLTAQNDPLDHLGRQLAQALTRHSGDLSHDVSERLRFARQQALAARFSHRCLPHLRPRHRPAHLLRVDAH